MNVVLKAIQINPLSGSLAPAQRDPRVACGEPSGHQATSRNRPLVRCLVVALLLFYPDAMCPAWASCRPGDSVWELSTRCLPDCPQLATEYSAELCQLEGGMWSARAVESIRQLVTPVNGQKLVVYVHGNRMPRQEARTRARIVYQTLVNNVNCEPICFVAFSWPSEQTERLSQDVSRKKLRLNADAYYLASFVRSLEVQRPIGYLGYSFGCAIVCGARHILSGGALHGYQLAQLPTAQYQDRLSLIAPAFDRQDLTAVGQYSRGLVGVDKMVNLYNSADPILRRFRFFDRSTSPTAAGYAGILEPRSISPLSADGKIVQYDCRSIGRTHAELDYLTCPCVFWAFQNVVGL